MMPDLVMCYLYSPANQLFLAACHQQSTLDARRALRAAPSRTSQPSVARARTFKPPVSPIPFSSDVFTLLALHGKLVSVGAVGWSI